MHKEPFFVVGSHISSRCNRHASVHSDGVTHHVARTRTAKPQHDGRDLLRSACATDRYVLGYVGVRVLVAADDISSNLCVDQTRIDSVHANAVLNVFQSGGSRKADHAVLDAM